jgi:hypothetical protein
LKLCECSLTTSLNGLFLSSSLDTLSYLSLLSLSRSTNCFVHNDGDYDVLAAAAIAAAAVTAIVGAISSSQMTMKSVDIAKILCFLSLELITFFC